MVLRRVVAMLLLLGPVQASAASIFANQGDAHGCTDHVCACVKACPTRKPAKPAAAAGHCHGESAPVGPLMKPAGCGHGGGDAVAPALAPPHVIPSPSAAAPLTIAATVALPIDARLQSGFLEIDIPPPRLS